MDPSPPTAEPIPPPLEASDLAGRTVATDVRLVANLGETQEGWLYRGASPDRGEVEVLVLPANPDGRGPPPTDLVGRVRCRVRRERIETAARFHHPSVAGILATGETPEGHPFLVRERPVGEPLSTFLGPETLLPPDAVLSLGAEAADALAAAHAAGLVHGNLSPPLLRVSTDGPAPPSLTLLGFTLGPFLQSKDEVVRLGGGYASPEQRFPVAADERSDVYSLGAILYHALAGSVPGPDPPVEPLPRSARTALRTALHERAGQRHASMAAFAAALRRGSRAAGHQAVRLPGPEPWERPSGEASRRRAIGLGAGAAVMVALLWLALSVGRHRENRGTGPGLDTREPAEIALSPVDRGGSAGGSVTAAPRPPTGRDSVIRSAVPPASPPTAAGSRLPVPGSEPPTAPPTAPPAVPPAVPPADPTGARGPETADFGGITAGQSWRPRTEAAPMVAGRAAAGPRRAGPQPWVSPFRKSHPWAASPTGRYYYPSRCPEALQFHDLLFFRTEADARAGGFVAAPDGSCS